ncbi:hypothetical protein DL96DRAFT_1713846 [Flagelloscypha sp. PMI_526]|nr:hypothetical protein DL96DRAFT_1713846 [Flagelloscypha sp. PMI_526]
MSSFEIRQPTLTLAIIGRVSKASTMTDQAQVLFDQANWQNAAPLFLQTCTLFADHEQSLPGVPGHEIRTKHFENLHPVEIAKYALAAGFLAQCHYHEKRYSQALSWAEEARVVWSNAQWVNPPLFDWIDFNITLPDMTRAMMLSQIVASKTFEALGNTSAASFCLSRAMSSYTSIEGRCENHDNNEQVQALYNTELTIEKMVRLWKLRHPDPRLVSSISVQDPTLQVKGAWVKRKDTGSFARNDFASFVWKGRLYIAGGKSTMDMTKIFECITGEVYSIDLQTFDSWHREAPWPYRNREKFFGQTMVIHREKAWLVTGKKRVDYFDLQTKQWGSIMTTFNRTAADEAAGVLPWPWTGSLREYAIQAREGKLYLFGGTDNQTSIGNNFLMELDLDTKRWRRLSGYPIPTVGYTIPGPRRYSSSWISKDSSKMYLTFGDANRPGGLAEYKRFSGGVSEPHANEEAYSPIDFWHWDFKKEKWVRERWAGNFPCPRTETSCVYNPKLDQVVMFGGYHPSLNTLIDPPGHNFTFSFFADTFVFGAPDPSNPGVLDPRWRHVITRSFPTPRCQSQIIVDPETGRTFVFGGYANLEFVPYGNAVERSRVFGDVWELRTDMPGGFYDEVDEEDEDRNARMGPWRKCYHCGSPSATLKKCGGSCNGGVSFCNNICLKAGWKEHKKDGCRKI